MLRPSTDLQSAARVVHSGTLSRRLSLGQVQIIAFVIGAPSVRALLEHIGEPILPPIPSPARGPPAGEDAPLEIGPEDDLLAQPAPEIAFDQTLQW